MARSGASRPSAAMLHQRLQALLRTLGPHQPPAPAEAVPGEWIFGCAGRLVCSVLPLPAAQAMPTGAALPRVLLWWQGGSCSGRK